MKVIGICGQAGAGKNTVGDMLDISVDTEQMALADPMKRFAQRVFGFTWTQLWGPSDKRNAPDYRFGTKGWRKLFSSTDVRALHTGVLLRVSNLDTFDWLISLFPDAPTSQINNAWLNLVGWVSGLLRDADRDGYLTPRKVLQTLGTEWGRDFSKDLWIDYTLRQAKEVLRANDDQLYVVITDVRFVNEAQKIRAAGGHVWRITRPGFDGSYANQAGVANHRSEQQQHTDEMAQYITKEIANDGTLSDLEGKVDEALNDVEATYEQGDVPGCG